ncbi:MAG: ABC transporter substrate-binding protein [Alphaproteobacteria bacterium]|nr:MAG: ABC transporter substrate-binding protein [Alphaproteobacteria bacterium]
MRSRRFVVASLAAIATFAALADTGRAEEELKIAVGGRGIGETFVTEIGYKAGLFKPHNLALDIFYTDGGGETQQAVISNSAQVGIASGFLGAIGVFAKGAPVRIIGGSYTGGAQVFWYVPVASSIKGPRDLSGKTVAYSNNGSSTHAGVLALQKHYNVDFKPTPTGNAAATMTATMSGQVDVGWAGAPFGVAELEAGKTRLIMKSSDAPDFDKQTSRVIIANATELKARPEVFVRFMRGYRDSLRWVYSTPEGLNAYANFAKLPQATAKRALQEFLPLAAVDPDRISGIEEVMADAVNFKFIAAPLTHADLAELIQIPERRQ